ncbi:Ig-like domain-containing protein [Mycolicibacterium sp. CR10]|uniref:L,D-transpeptidase n=1 Tax=Mycolicibacterium sp. CR10 TaxID=2562314 RepID=UPI003510E237
MLLPWSRRAYAACAAAVVAAVLLLGGDVSRTSVQCTENCEIATAAQTRPFVPPAPQAAAVQVLPGALAEDVDPAGPVFVVARSGTLDDVTMENESGTLVPGVLTPDRKSWRPAEPLGYGRTYSMEIAARGPGGMPSRQTSSFSTVSPEAQAAVYLNTTAGIPIKDGGTYGVGVVVVARFDSPIEDKAAAERRLHVRTDPPIAGSWNWMDDQTAHWRPEKYYPPGTSVDVTAHLYGARLGDGLYGEEDKHVSFTIGDSHVSIADDTTKQVSVFENGKLVRTMPTSMGMGGTETVAGNTFSFWTPSGVYSVLDKANPVVMDSSTYGLPTGSSLGYRTTVPYATRISTDGIYLHQLNATVWAQGNTNVSHGCLNLSGEHAKWFYDFSVPGDIVEVRNTGGPPLQLQHNGDWGVPWEQWRQGSALNK